MEDLVDLVLERVHLLRRGPLAPDDDAEHDTAVARRQEGLWIARKRRDRAREQTTQIRAEIRFAGRGTT
jgi:hypothetical protein